MIQKLKESKPMIGLVCLAVLLVVGFVVRTYWIAPTYIYFNDAVSIVEDDPAKVLKDALQTLFWLPGACYAIMYLLYVKAQHGVDPAAEMRKNGTAMIMLLVLVAAELVLSYLVLNNSMHVMQTMQSFELEEVQKVQTALFKAYGLATGVDVILYLPAAFLGRPRR